MSTAPSVFDQRISYRSAVVDLVNTTFDPQIKKANDDIALWQDQINALQSKIGDAKQFIAEVRHLQQHASDHADLPGAPLPPAHLPPLSVMCRACSQPIVKTVDGKWVHTGRELMEHGDRCDPKVKLPVAEPAKGDTQAFNDWNGAINDERSGVVS